jgi:hypothetical protein
MSSAVERRLAEIEDMLAAIERHDGAGHRRDPFEMTDSEAVEEWHRLNHLPLPRVMLPKFGPEEEAAIIAKWRRLRG